MSAKHCIWSGKMVDDFGIIIACYEKDYSFAKGCCASVRYFLGEVPICLIVDGDFSTKDLESTYNVGIINKHNVSNEFLRKKSFGYGLTKMVAFWESPWDTFLYLDADTVVWGDLLRIVDFSHHDFVADLPKYKHSKEEIGIWFFDVDKLLEHFPKFDWENHDYFCTGVFFSKRDVFDIEEYESLLALREADPSLFKCGEQGILNLMIFNAVLEGSIKLYQFPIQTIVPDFRLSQLASKYKFDSNKPCPQDQEASVIHWCGRKPFFGRRGAYDLPMSFFRYKFLLDRLGGGIFLNKTFLILEDIYVYFPKLIAKFLQTI